MPYDAASHPLDVSAPMPPLELTLTDGTTLRLPDELDGRFGVLLVYRGEW